MFTPSVRWDYETIKRLASDLRKKGIRTTVEDLLALASKNDPFYVGTDKDIQQAEWFAGIWKQTSGRHLRGIHYWTASQHNYIMPDGRTYENTERHWEYIQEASKKARYLGLVPIDELEDHKAPDVIKNAKYENTEITFGVYGGDFQTPSSYADGFNDADYQPYHLEVWIEKSSMNRYLMPICNRFNANLATFTGEVSITACHQLIKRIQQSGNKPTRIFYISDFDPAGNSMPVAMSRKVEYGARTYAPDLDVKVVHVALNLEQVQQYKLPRKMIKETELRAASFENSFGAGAVELDALEGLYPGVFASIVTTAMKPYYDEKIAKEVQRKKWALENTLDKQIATITEKYQEHLDALQTMREEILQIEIDTEPFKVERPDPLENEPHEWLFDSSRDYLDQIKYYKSHKGLISTL